MLTKIGDFLYLDYIDIDKACKVEGGSESEKESPVY